MNKAELRKQIKETLASPVIKDTLASQSREICSQIISSRLYTSCTTLLAYMPLEDEVDIRPVIEAALKSEKKVFLPRVWPESNRMEFYQYDEKTLTKTGSFGILEPEPD
jgi:5-formyltetrahydrofolate cyclo-ligase